MKNGFHFFLCRPASIYNQGEVGPWEYLVGERETLNLPESIVTGVIVPESEFFNETSELWKRIFNFDQDSVIIY